MQELLFKGDWGCRACIQQGDGHRLHGFRTQSAGFVARMLAGQSSISIASKILDHTVPASVAPEGVKCALHTLSGCDITIRLLRSSETESLGA